MPYWHLTFGACDIRNIVDGPYFSYKLRWENMRCNVIFSLWSCKIDLNMNPVQRHCDPETTVCCTRSKEKLHNVPDGITLYLDYDRKSIFYYRLVNFPSDILISKFDDHVTCSNQWRMKYPVGVEHMIFQRYAWFITKFISLA